MDQDIIPGIDTNSAAHAFGEVRAEISLLRRAVERLTDERIAQPDYAPSLEAIGKRPQDIAEWAKRVSEKPALKLTPDSLGREIAEAATNSRAQDRELLERAADAMESAGDRIDAMIARSRSVAEQNRAMVRNCIASAVAGMVLFAIVPGAIARSLPVIWAVPERIAARMLGADMWQAGQDMMAKADPEKWNRIVEHERKHGPLPHK